MLARHFHGSIQGRALNIREAASTSRCMASDPQSRVAMAREAASQLLEELETSIPPVAQSLMRAKRLARLLRDQDAQTWIDLEIKGYPNDFNCEVLGNCRRYAVEGGRMTPDGKYYLQSLPGIEANCRAQETTLDPPQQSSATGVAADFL